MSLNFLSNFTSTSSLKSLSDFTPTRVRDQLNFAKGNNFENWFKGQIHVSTF